MDDDEHLEDPALAHIILDLISSALGGAILLGIILSITRVSQSPAGSTAPYLLVRLEVRAPDNAADPNALPNLWIKPPGAVEGINLPLERFDLTTGRPRPVGSADEGASWLRTTGREFQILGFYRHGEGEARVRSAEQNMPQVPIAMLYIAEPMAGVWSFRVRYQNRRDLDFSSASIPPIVVHLNGQVAQGPSVPPLVERIDQFGSLSNGELKLEVRENAKTASAPPKKNAP